MKNMPLSQHLYHKAYRRRCRQHGKFDPTFYNADYWWLVLTYHERLAAIKRGALR